MRDQAKHQQQLIMNLQNKNHVMDDSLQIGEQSQYYDLDMIMSPPVDDKENEYEPDDDEERPSKSKRSHAHLQSRHMNISRVPTSLNRNPLGDHPTAPIMQDDLEDDFDFDMAGCKPYRSDWNIPGQGSKKRKLREEMDKKSISTSKTPVPLNVVKGRVHGAVHIGPRVKMNKHN